MISINEYFSTNMFLYDLYSGQGTISLEFLEQASDIDTLIVPISGKFNNFKTLIHYLLEILICKSASFSDSG